MKYSVKKDARQPTKLVVTVTDDADKVLRIAEMDCTAETIAAQVDEFAKLCMVEVQRISDGAGAKTTTEDAAKTTVTSLAGSIAKTTVSAADLAAFKTSKGLT